MGTKTHFFLLLDSSPGVGMREVKTLSWGQSRLLGPLLSSAASSTSACSISAVLAAQGTGSLSLHRPPAPAPPFQTPHPPALENEAEKQIIDSLKCHFCR